MPHVSAHVQTFGTACRFTMLYHLALREDSCTVKRMVSVNQLHLCQVLPVINACSVQGHAFYAAMQIKLGGPKPSCDALSNM